MKRKKFSLMSVAVGAGLMFLLDPDKGKRRRALIRDQFVHFKHKISDEIAATSNDARNRAYGFIARAKSAFKVEKANDDAIAHKVAIVVKEIASRPEAIQYHVSKTAESLFPVSCSMRSFHSCSLPRSV